MEVRRINGFTGAIPTLDRTLIADNSAQAATNVYLTSGRLDAITAPKPIQEVNKAQPKTIYRMFNDIYSYWLSWNEQVDVAESPVYVENNFRIAFSSPDFEPRQTDLTLAADSVDQATLPAKWYVLGMTPPVTAPTVSSVTGGSGTNVSRTYVYTFANSWGEESAPSPASTVFAGTPDGGWNLTLPDVAPLNTYSVTAVSYASGKLRLTLDTVFGLRAKEIVTLAGLSLADLNDDWRIDSLDVANKYAYVLMNDPGAITLTSATAARLAPHNLVGLTKRVYRSVTTADGTGFFLVGSDIPAATTSFVDNTTVIGEQLETLEWAMPPADLQGLVTHSSGCLVGFRGNEIYISEPYAPYAYKVSNVQVMDYQVVGLAAFGQSVIIGTKGRPYILSFVAPETATPQKLDQHWPCLSKRGMISYNGGVYYPSTVGLAFVGTSGAILVTDKYYSQQDWAKVNPGSFIAGHFDNRYYAIYTTDGVSKVLIISDESGVSEINLPFTALYSDRGTGDIYGSYDFRIWQLYGDLTNTLEYSWTSKEFVPPNPVNLGAAKVDFSSGVDQSLIQDILGQNDSIKATNVANFLTPMGAVGFNEIAANEVNYTGLTDLLPTDGLYYVTFTLLVDNQPVFSKLVPSNQVFRLPGGRKYDHYSIRMSGTAPVAAVVIGETPTSLKQV